MQWLDPFTEPICSNDGMTEEEDEEYMVLDSYEDEEIGDGFGVQLVDDVTDDHQIIVTLCNWTMDTFVVTSWYLLEYKNKGCYPRGSP